MESNGTARIDTAAAASGAGPAFRRCHAPLLAD